MKYEIFLIVFFILILSVGCQQSKNIDIPSPANESYKISVQQLTPEEINDKILGAIVGSAIGDAMGASTEMWHRKDIQQTYGYINDLTPAIRSQSPEGTWQHDLIAGATTDDTRWKFLFSKYLIDNNGDYSAKNFAVFINTYYDQLVSNLAAQNNLDSTDALDANIEKVDWIKEWARVSKAYVKGQEFYQLAQHRFYGGEMSCAGLLYSPMIGLAANNSIDAYTQAYDHAIFDIGYAKDISATASLMTYFALYNPDFTAIVDSSLMIDPHNYRDSRLIGRLVQSMAVQSKDFIAAANEIEIPDSSIVDFPIGYTGTKRDWVQQEYIYKQLENNQKAIAFHSGEIWQILYTSLLYGNGDFLKTMAFIVNYGRDNDTVAAIAGMILGAHVGFSNLPHALRSEVVTVNRDVIGIDLETLSNEVVNTIGRID